MDFDDYDNAGGGRFLTYLGWKAATGRGGGFFETKAKPDSTGEREIVSIPIPKPKGLIFWVDGHSIETGFRRFDDRWVDWGYVKYGEDMGSCRPPDEEFKRTSLFQGVQVPNPPKRAVKMRVFCEDWTGSGDVDQLLEWTTNQTTVINEPSFRRILATWRDLAPAEKADSAMQVRLEKSEMFGRNKNHAPVFDEKIGIKPRPQAFIDFDESAGDAAPPNPQPTSSPAADVAAPVDDWAA